jgi:hypothetical protein
MLPNVKRKPRNHIALKWRQPIAAQQVSNGGGGIRTLLRISMEPEVSAAGIIFFVAFVHPVAS